MIRCLAGVALLCMAINSNGFFHFVGLLVLAGWVFPTNPEIGRYDT